MAIPDKTQFAEPVATTFSVLPSKYPALPEDVLKRFPSLETWGKEQTRLYTRIREAFESQSTDLAAPINELKETTSNLSVQAGAFSASLTEEIDARVGADFALSTRTTTLETQVQTPGTGLLARVSTIETAYVDADTALASRTTTLETQVQTPTTGLLSRVSTIETAYVAADSALASRATTLESQVQTPTTGLLARVSTIETTYATQTFAETKKTEAITAAAANTTAVVDTESSARATADGFLAGKYTLTVAAGNVVTGMNITSASSGGTSISDVVFQATSFRIYNGSTGVAPFQVIGGTVRITGSLVLSSSDISGLGSLATQNTVDAGSQVTGLAATATNSDYGAITGTKPPPNADVTLAAINGGLTITSGGITLNGSPTIQSYNFVPGSSGWRIDGGGSVEFASGTFRGDLQIGTTNSIPGYGNSDQGFSVEATNGTFFASRGDNFAGSLNRNGSGDILLFHRFGSQVGSVSVNTSTTSYNTTSDSRLKRVLESNVTNCSLIDLVRVREYEFLTEPGVRHIGVMAQELYSVYPWAVTPGDTSPTFDPAVSRVWQVDYSKLVPLLIREIQLLRARLTAIGA